MTLDELVEELVELQEAGFGNLEVYKQSGACEYDTLVEDVCQTWGIEDTCPDYCVQYIEHTGLTIHEPCIFIR